jgi:hypothetical protein
MQGPGLNPQAPQKKKKANNITVKTKRNTK